MEFTSPLLDVDEEDRFVLRGVVHEEAVDLAGDYKEFNCSGNGVLVGMYNSGGTKNFKDLTKAKCMSFEAVNPQGRHLDIRAMTRSVPFVFTGNNEEVHALCDANEWASGIKKGKNDNPNEASYNCRHVYAVGYPEGNEEERIGTPANILDIVPNPSTPAGRLTNTGWKEGSNRWGSCANGQAAYAWKVVDKGSNLYDIQHIRCSDRAHASGSLSLQYQTLGDMDSDIRDISCCESDEYPLLDRAARRSACRALGSSPDMSEGTCVGLGLNDFCQGTTESGVPNLMIDPGCMKWCNRYPSTCDAAKVKWCSDNPNSPWCDCLQATKRQEYQEMAGEWSALATTPTSCWWGPCKEENSYVLSTAETRAQRTSCPDIISQTLYINGDGNIVDANFDVIQNIQNSNFPDGWLRKIEDMTCEEREEIFGPELTGPCATIPDPDTGTDPDPDPDTGTDPDPDTGTDPGTEPPPFDFPDLEEDQSFFEKYMWIILAVVGAVFITILAVVLVPDDEDEEEDLEIFTESPT